MTKTNGTGPPLRAALYIRVSSEEQAIRGLSLEAQQEDLERYVKDHGWIIAGTYIDAAKTARKDIRKREAFQRMLSDVQLDKIDIILFTRLDRWFRSIADYYSTIGILEAHHVNWKTTQEDYDTTTANGKLYINLKLSLAQNEADITSERIAAVFDSKIRNGTVISGSAPFWLRVNKEKRLELIPEKVKIAQEAFDLYEKTGTIRSLADFLRSNGVSIDYNDIRPDILTNTLSFGLYESRGRVRPDFAPAIITKEQFDRVQALLARNIRRPPSGRVYIFTGLLRCWDCGRTLVSLHDPRYDRNYYRCNNGYLKSSPCSNNLSVREADIESQLFEAIGPSIEAVRAEWEVKEAKRRKSPGPSPESIRRKLTRLKELYVNDLISMEEYKRDYDQYNAQLLELSVPEPELQRPNFEAVEKVLTSDFRTLYASMTREEQRSVWRSILSSVIIGKNRRISRIEFL